MHITIAAVGKAKSSDAAHSLTNDFLVRLPWKITFREVELKKQLPEFKRKNEEASLLLNACPPNSILIALDEHGKQPDSPAFAKLLGNYRDDGHAQISFLIGGAYGHGKAVLDKAHHTIAFGKMTWPHMLVRTLLAEQLYRSYTILTNHPYHKV